ncbi:hypothetical protein HDU93_008601 [Gonapodya sp. JEL0774]|nr:hypothetical protein HDU93_008601 [Gonapodya sp. JEL0774]
MLISHYRPGSGAEGSVYLCVHVPTKKKYALKEVYKSGKGEARHTPPREIQILSKLYHPHLIELVDWFESKTQWHLVFELANGGELLQRIVSKGWYRERDAAGVILICVNEYKIVKTANLLFKEDAFNSPLVIVDFVGFQSLTAAIEQEFNANLNHDSCEEDPLLGPTLRYVDDGRDYASPLDIDERVKKGNFDFPSPAWDNISDLAKDLIRALMAYEPEKRLTAKQALDHPWIVKYCPPAYLKWLKDMNTELEKLEAEEEPDLARAHEREFAEAVKSWKGFKEGVVPPSDIALPHFEGRRSPLSQAAAAEPDGITEATHVSNVATTAQGALSGSPVGSKLISVTATEADSPPDTFTTLALPARRPSFVEKLVSSLASEKSSSAKSASTSENPKPPLERRRDSVVDKMVAVITGDNGPTNLGRKQSFLRKAMTSMGSESEKTSANMGGSSSTAVPVKAIKQRAMTNPLISKAMPGVLDVVDEHGDGEDNGGINLLDLGQSDGEEGEGDTVAPEVLEKRPLAAAVPTPLTQDTPCAGVSPDEASRVPLSRLPSLAPASDKMKAAAAGGATCGTAPSIAENCEQPPSVFGGRQRSRTESSSGGAAPFRARQGSMQVPRLPIKDRAPSWTDLSNSSLAPGVQKPRATSVSVAVLAHSGENMTAKESKTMELARLATGDPE